MKKFLLLSLAMVAVFTFSTQAQAGFLLEPYFGTHMNSQYKSNNCSSDCEKDVTGTAMGARVGFQSMGLMLGLDAKMAALDVQDSDDPLNYNRYGFFIGYDFPIMLRLWYTHHLSQSTELDSNNPVTYNMGSGYTIGVGYKLMPFVSLNLEVGNDNYDQLEQGSTKVDADIDVNTYMLSLSFPISI
jgi:hypothetical protein